VSGDEIPSEFIEEKVSTLRRDAELGGYFLNPDDEFVRQLAKGLCINEKRYGYPSCPCRLAVGRREEDRDIICPCDYRDPDLEEFGACYCALYVSPSVAQGRTVPGPVPERRPPRSERSSVKPRAGKMIDFPLPVWRCRVCGYLCARETPPLVCPVCKASKDRFERFL
jgi:ferredoxin-thioredoxin reductase catalytic subunit